MESRGLGDVYKRQQKGDIALIVLPVNSIQQPQASHMIYLPMTIQFLLLVT
jgi:hypothetical protein